MLNREERGDRRKKSMFTWDYWNKGWPAGWPTTGWQGRLLPLPGSEVLSVLSLLLSEFLFCVGPECPSRGSLHSNGFPGAFSKGTKGAGGWGCLRAVEAWTPPYPCK